MLKIKEKKEISKEGGKQVQKYTTPSKKPDIMKTFASDLQIFARAEYAIHGHMSFL